MALTPEQVEEVTSLLQEHPDWPTSQVRAEAGLSPRELFAVKRLRTQLGIAEPGNPDGKRRGTRTKQRTAADTLDESPVEPSGPKRKGGAKRPQSPLAPILPRIAQSIVRVVMGGTAKLTSGRAPMTVQEAAAVAVPLVRIADREIAKHWKASGKSSENAEDVGLILMTILGWLLGVIIASVSGTPRAAQQNARMPAENVTDLFGGSEPINAGASDAPAARHAATSPQPAEDESDLFDGSEPLAAGTTAGAHAGGGRAAGRSGPADQVTLSDTEWAALMPTDLGGSEVA